jgi:hypothetical protein
MKEHPITPSRRLHRHAIHAKHPPRMSHSAGPWIAISPTMGATTRRRGQHHAPPSFPVQKAHRIYLVGTSTTYP